MMKYLKNNKGFTLVEVIVVAVIVLILAAVAIPLYQGYMKDSRISVATSTAAAIASAMGAANQAALGANFTGNFDTNDPQIFTVLARGVDGETVSIVLPKSYTGTFVSDDVVVYWNGQSDISGAVRFK